MWQIINYVSMTGCKEIIKYQVTKYIRNYVSKNANYTKVCLKKLCK